MTLAERLKEIEAREKAATPGEWEAYFNGTIDNYYVWTKEKPRKYLCSARPENAELIAAAKSDIPLLLSLVKEAMAGLEKGCWAKNLSVFGYEVMVEGCGDCPNCATLERMERIADE